jgi:hypothetical protein
MRFKPKYKKKKNKPLQPLGQELKSPSEISCLKYLTAGNCSLCNIFYHFSWLHGFERMLFSTVFNMGISIGKHSCADLLDPNFHLINFHKYLYVSSLQSTSNLRENNKQINVTPLHTLQLTFPICYRDW